MVDSRVQIVLADLLSRSHRRLPQQLDVTVLNADLNVLLLFDSTHRTRVAFMLRPRSRGIIRGRRRRPHDLLLTSTAYNYHIRSRWSRWRSRSRRRHVNARFCCRFVF